MMILILSAIIAICAILVGLNPNLINGLSEEQRQQMDTKKTRRIAFWGLMTTALVLAILYIIGVRNELMPIFVVIPGAIITATLVQCSIPNKK